MEFNSHHLTLDSFLHTEPLKKSHLTSGCQNSLTKTYRTIRQLEGLFCMKYSISFTSTHAGMQKPTIVQEMTADANCVGIRFIDTISGTATYYHIYPLAVSWNFWIYYNLLSRQWSVENSLLVVFYYFICFLFISLVFLFIVELLL